MLDLALKYLPILIFIVPLISWLDKKKRYFHNSKFYLERAQLLKIYEEESRRVNITENERNAFAQAYVASDKIGYRDIEIVKQHYTRDTYYILQKIVKVGGYLEIVETGNNFYYKSKFSLKQAHLRYLWITCFYFSSLLILYSNTLFLKLFNFFNFSPFIVSEFTLVTWQVILILGALAIIGTAMSIFIKNEILIELIKSEKLFQCIETGIVEERTVVENEILI